MTKGKTHLGPVKRAGLELGLGCGKSLKAMGRELGVSASTLSREIRKHTYESFKGCYGRGNQCVHRAMCTVHDICSERTLSRYLHYGLFTAKRGDMKRSCTVRERNPKSGDYAHKVEKGCYQGRDFRTGEAFRREHPSLAVVYMDLVIGRPGGQCLMTLHWKDTGFMVAILIPNKCADNVVAVFDRLYEELGHETFTRLFGIIITDRGTEFSNPSRIEFSRDGERRTWVFFCDPMNSNQKSQEERNHELVREVLPKGVSFDGLTQEDASLMMSHVNAYVRLSQSDRTPYDVFEFIHGEGTAAKLGISKIDPREVVLKPRLLGIEMK